MDRRIALQWMSGTMATMMAAVVAIPGVSFVVDSLRRGAPRKAIVQRLARLRDLPRGKPVQVNVVGNRRDAWTAYPEEVLGRVWLVRNAEEADREKDNVVAFTAICPHLGCNIQLSPKGESFVCPCHRAAFALDGTPRTQQELGHRNHAPRGIDALECRLVQDADTDEVWVEVKYEKFEAGLTRKVAKV